MTGNSPLDTQRQRMLASLAPLLSLAGTFVQQVAPVPETILPFVLFVFLRNRDQPLARDMALRTADFAFSMFLWLVVLVLGILTLQSIQTTAPLVPEQAVHWTYFLVRTYLRAMLIVGIVQGLRGKELRYPLSVRLAERVFAALEKRAKGGSEAGEKS